MSRLNIYNVKKKILDLMDANNLKQKDLLGILHMSQPNLSKSLSLSSKKFFTIEQLMNIADYFGVSIDILLGYDSNVGKDKRSTANWIVNLLLSGEAETATITKHEVIHDWPYDSDQYWGTTAHEADNEYTAIYFPNYWQPDTTDMTEEDLEDLSLELTANGNANNNFELNRFLHDFAQILLLYKRHQLPEEAFQSTINHYLDKLPTTVKKPSKSNDQK